MKTLLKALGLIMLMLFPFNKLLAEDAVVNVGNIYYGIDEEHGTAYVNGCTGFVSIMVIDSVVVYDGKEYPVTKVLSVYDDWGDRTRLTEVRIPGSVTELNKYLFSNKTSLKTVYLPMKDGKGTITDLPEGIFNGCTSLEFVYGYFDLKNIGDFAFRNCSSLNSLIALNIPNVETIGWCAFEGSNYAGYLIPSTVKSIGQSAFARTQVVKVSVPEGITELNNTFGGCVNLQEVKLPKSLVSLVNGAFYNCHSLEYIELPAGLETIGENAFYHCCSLYSITIPSSVKTIGRGAFSACSSLSSINFPVGLTSIGRDAFSACTSLASIKLPTGLESIGDGAFWRCPITSISLPAGLKSIGNETFSDCKLSGTVSIPSSIEAIGSNPFKYTKVEVLDYQGDVKSWCENVALSENWMGLGYSDCGFRIGGKDLTELEIPEGVTKINPYAFENVQNIASIKIPSSLRAIGEKAFYNDKLVRKVDIPSFETWCNIDFADEYSNPFYYKGDFYIDGKLIDKVEIPEGVDSIGKYAFLNCSANSIVIPSSLKKVGADAFNGSSLKGVYISDLLNWCNIEFFTSLSNPLSCESSPLLYLNNEVVRDVKIPAGVSEVKDFAFIDYGYLYSVNISEGVTAIGNSAFQNCDSLQTITLPSTLKSIGTWAFAGCNDSDIHYIHNKMHTPLETSGGMPYGRLYVPLGASRLYEDEYLYTSTGSRIPNPWSSFNVLEEGIKFNINEASLSGGQTVKLQVLNEDKTAFTGALTWESSDTNVATVDATGLVTADASGTVVIKAMTNDENQFSALCTVTVHPKAVSIDIEETEVSVVDRTSKNLTLIVSPSDALNVFSWKSSNEDVVSVNNDGRVWGENVGTAIITVTSTDGTNLSDSCKVVVTPALTSSIKLRTSNVSINKNETYKLVATILPDLPYNKTLKWESLDESIATVDDAGIITGVGVGSTKVSATTVDGSNLSDTCVVNILPPLVQSVMLDRDSLVLHKEDVVVLKATLLPEDAGNKDLSWRCLNPGVATVDGDGNVTAVALGETDIIVSTRDGSGLSDTCHVTVRQRVVPIVWEQEFNVVVGDKVVLQASIPDGMVVFKAGGYAEPTIGYDGETWTATFNAVGKAEIEASAWGGDPDCEYPPVRKVFNVLPDRDVLLIDGIYYRYADDAKKSLKVASGYDLYEGDVVVPSVAGGLPVIGVDNRTFYSNRDLKSVVLSEGIERIESEQVFGDCASLVSVDLPSSLKYIGSFTFNVCDGLDEIHCRMKNPADVELHGGAALFNDFVDYETCILYVPEGCVDAYRAADVWSNFKNIVEEPLSPVNAVFIKLDKEELELFVGETATLSAAVYPENAENKSVVWVSSDDNVVVVDEVGRLSTVGFGSASIMACVNGTDVKATCVVKVLQKGDSNGDNAVTVTDAVNTANYAVEKDVAIFNVRAADVNGDETITMADASGTISIVLEQPVLNSATLAMAMSNVTRGLGDVLVVDDYSLKPGETATLSVGLDNLTDYVALQADVVMPDGLTLEGVETGGRAEATHSLFMRQVADDVYRVVLFSASGQAFANNKEPLFMLKVKSERCSDGDITFERILAADAEATEYRLSYTGGHNTLSSGINGVDGGVITVRPCPGGLEVLNAEGLRVYVYGFDGSLLTSFVADADGARLPLRPGVYIVKVGTLIYKVAIK